jgi:hypothetical protein
MDNQMKPEFTIFKTTYCRVTTLEQFVKQGPEHNRARRNGLTYYIAYTEDAHTIMVEYTLDNCTDAKHLLTAIKLGLVYMTKFDSALTTASIPKQKS